MNKHTKEIIGTIGMKAQYDENAKKLLSNKIFLAHILKGTVTEFKDANPRDIISLIEGEPYVSTVSVEPGMTNQVLENPKLKVVIRKIWKQKKGLFALILFFMFE